MTLLELAERCEQATGSDRELDAVIGQALGWQLLEMSNFDTGRTWHEWKRPPGVKLPLGTMAEPPFYTASLDAAMTLAADNLSLWFLLTEAAKRCAMATESSTEAEFRLRLPQFVSAAALRAIAVGEAETPTDTSQDSHQSIEGDE